MSTHVDLIAAEDVGTSDEAGIGALATSRGNLPLDELTVRATIIGLNARTELTQGFQNPFDEPLEATYIFPLPSRSAVTALRMEADGRVVEGVLKERGEARAEYDQAVADGKRASIAEEERPGVFTMRVGNIQPGERVTVRLTVVGPLPYADSTAEFRFPLVVAPRYIPGTPLSGAPVGDGTAPDTDAVPDASRISPPVLLPGFPNPVRLSAEVRIDPAGLPLNAVRSSLHTVVVDSSGETFTVRLAPGERADRDFVLRLSLGAKDAVTTSLTVVPDADGGTFALTVLPPATGVATRPRDVVLVLDRSGSMAGWKMVAARRAAARIVDTLGDTDRFAVLTFDNRVETAPENGLVAATDRNRFRAVEHLAGITARGGTEMATPLISATNLLCAEEDPQRDQVLVLVTDGQVANEDQLLQMLGSRLAALRVHTVGIDTAVNEAFLHRLAAAGGGRCELVESESRLDEAMSSIHHRIASPLVTHLALHADALDIDHATVSPARLPDVFQGAPVVVTGRFRGAPAGAITVSGSASGTDWRTTVSAIASAEKGLAVVWARARVRDLEDRYAASAAGDLSVLEQEIVATSLRFGVLCRFTAFVAVDTRVVNEGGTVRRVTQPVDLPQGWDVPVAASAGYPAAAPMFALQAMPDSAAGRPGNRSMRRAMRPPATPVPMQPPATPVPIQPPASPVPGKLLVAFAVEQLAALRAVDDNEDVRSAALDRLAERIREFLVTTPAQALQDLLSTLDEETTYERRWYRAIEVLKSLAPFWKR